MKHWRVLARIVHDEITGLSEEVRSTVSPDSTRIAPLSSGLPRPARLGFENGVDLPTIEQSAEPLLLRKVVSVGNRQTLPQIARSSSVIQTEIIRIGSYVAAIGTIHIECFGVRVSDIRAEAVEVARGHRDLKPVVIGRHAIRQTKD